MEGRPPPPMMLNVGGRMIPLAQAATMTKSGLSLPIAPAGRPSEHALASSNTARRQGKGGFTPSPQVAIDLPVESAGGTAMAPAERRRSSTAANAQTAAAAESTAVVAAAALNAAAATVARRGSIPSLPPPRGASFLDWLVATSGGRFQKSALDGTAFVYLKVGRHLYDLHLSTGLECGAVRPRPGLNAAAIASDAEAQMAARFVILSMQGLTCNINGDVSFISLGRFELEWARYQQLMQRPFFRSFRVWRVFELWKRGLRQRRFEVRKAALQRALFTADGTLRPALIELRRFCLQISSLKLFAIEPTTHSLREWLEQQERARHAVASAFSEIFGEVRRLVLYAAAVSLERHMRELGLESHGDPVIPVPQPPAGGSAVAAEVAGGLGVAPKYCTMFAMPKDLRYTTRAAARTQCHRLLRFVRLADFSLWAALQVGKCIDGLASI
jgi:hypothetical protein